MTLKEQRWAFTQALAQLIIQARLLGYDVALGEVKRTAAQAQANSASGAGIKNSLHLLCLAADLDLYIKGVYQETTEAHRQLGSFWKTLHPLARWGGDFRPKPDGNHYSFEWEGKK